MRPAGPVCLLVAILVCATAVSADRASRPDPDAALREGNREFREGRLEAAVDAYRHGLVPGVVDPLLAYNLGTSLHRLGRLPEAVLWYRRAQAAGSSDPWLAENLERARADLSAVRVGPPALLVPALEYPWLPRAAAAALAWAGLLTALLAPPRARPLAGVLLIAALAAWAGAAVVRRVGPRPAVVLSACAPSLPAGSEVWLVREPAGGYRVSGTGHPCPADAVGLVGPVTGPERP